jgi:hypothetical protein
MHAYHNMERKYMVEMKKLPVQARLTNDELAVLDKMAMLASARSGGAEISRAEALRVAGMRGAAMFIQEWTTGGGSMSAPAPVSLTPLQVVTPAEEETLPADLAPPVTPARDPIAALSQDQEAEEAALAPTPLQQVALAAVPPEVVEEAAAVPVPELENSVDLGGARAGAGYDTARLHLGQLCMRGHDWQGTGKTLRHIKDNTCVECKRVRDREAQQTRRTQQRGTKAKATG